MFKTLTLKDTDRRFYVPELNLTFATLSDARRFIDDSMAQEAFNCQCRPFILRLMMAQIPSSALHYTGQPRPKK